MLAASSPADQHTPREAALQEAALELTESTLGQPVDQRKRMLVHDEHEARTGIEPLESLEKATAALPGMNRS